MAGDGGEHWWGALVGQGWETLVGHCYYYYYYDYYNNAEGNGRRWWGALVGNGKQLP